MSNNVTILLVLFRPGVIETDIFIGPGGVIEGRPEIQDKASCDHVISPQSKNLNVLMYCSINRAEQRMRVQLLWLMYMLSKDVSFLKVPNRITRRVDRIVFNVPNRILSVYERSPYYVGTKLWDDLPNHVQELDNVFAFKKEIRRRHRTYVKL